MIDYLRTIISGQLEAALCMLKECIERCPEEHWEGKIGNDTFRQVAYHTLFYVDVYGSEKEAPFQLRELHQRGGDERASSQPSAGLSKAETLGYAAECHAKAVRTLAAETAESLQSPSGVSWLPFSRGELHLYNLRHVQHHTGQLSAFLRKVTGSTESWWVRKGWR